MECATGGLQKCRKFTCSGHTFGNLVAFVQSSVVSSYIVTSCSSGVHKMQEIVSKSAKWPSMSKVFPNRKCSTLALVDLAAPECSLQFRPVESGKKIHIAGKADTGPAWWWSSSFIIVTNIIFVSIVVTIISIANNKMISILVTIVISIGLWTLGYSPVIITDNRETGYSIVLV